MFGKDNEFRHGDDGVVGLVGDEVFSALGDLLVSIVEISPTS